jgi:signal peptidase I
MRPYSLKKSRTVLKTVYAWYKKKGKTLPQELLKKLEEEMEQLDAALLRKDREAGSVHARSLEALSNSHSSKSFLEYTWELCVALAFALVIATLVRQVWFELYEIPTGSMRPTFREQDHLTVTKTAFGINFPLETKHLYFDPHLVQRGSVLIFSGDGLPLPDVDTTYFGIFPYKKRYIKRLIGKPGDALYFYGGKIYGVDQEGHELTELRAPSWMQNLEYIPFLSFDGQVEQGKDQTLDFEFFNKPMGKIAFHSRGELLAEVFNGESWVKDDPMAASRPHDTVQTLSDLFGIRNYAMARLLTKEQLKKLPDVPEDLEEGLLYLHLHHTPSLAYPSPIVYTAGGGRVNVAGYSAYLPLKQEHLDALMQNLYTARFMVEEGRARRYEIGSSKPTPGNPRFSGVPDGTYEFYHGVLSSIHWGGISTQAAKDNPLYSRNAENVQKLFNLGIEMNSYYSSAEGNQVNFPHRYAYFRDGSLYLLGAPIVKKEDPLLIAFNLREKEREAKATKTKPYVAFKDYGSPLKEGKLDVEFIRTFGITVPEKAYLVLGDNHAMSSDSRVFGFVPQANLQGAPVWIIWPPGDRLGPPSQKPYPFLNLPRAIIWSIALVLFLLWYSYHRWRLSRPIFLKKVS